jgi:pimeloyl-ACP methyl ester carboxylesterase
MAGQAVTPPDTKDSSDDNTKDSQPTPRRLGPAAQQSPRPGSPTSRHSSTSTRPPPAWKTIPSWYFISTNDQIITAASELAMAHRAHSHITLFHGGSHLTLISHPNAATAVIASAVCSLR